MRQQQLNYLGGLILLIAISQWPFEVGNIGVITMRSLFYGLLLMYFVLIAMRRKTRKIYLRRLIWPPVLLLITSIILSTLTNGKILQTAIGGQTAGNGSLLAVLFVVGLLAMVTVVKIIPYRALYLTVITVAFISLLEYLITGSYLESVRLVGIMGQPVLFAVLLAATYIFGIFYRPQINLQDSTWLLCQLLLFILTIATMSRGVIYPLVLFNFTVLCRYYFKTQMISFKTINRNLTLVVATSLVVLTVAVGSGAAGRIFNGSKLKYAFEFRLAMIDHAVSQANIVPLLGFGHDQIYANMGVYKQLPPVIEEKVIAGEIDVFDSVHNIFIDYWLQYGVTGFIAISWLLGAAMISGIRQYRQSRHAQFLTITFVILLLQSFVNPAFNEYLLLLFPISFLLLFNFKQHNDYLLNKQEWLGAGFIAIAAVLVLYNYDTTIASRRLSRVVRFPLATTQAIIKQGSSYNGVTLVWDNQMQYNYHHDYSAVDIHVPDGTPVIAAVPGTVVFVRHGECSGDTFPAIIIHGLDGLYYLYSHLAPDSIPYYKDQYVGDGAVLGAVGDSICSQNAAPHLHFDVSRVYEPHRGTIWSDMFMLNVQAPLVRAFQSLPME